MLTYSDGQQAIKYCDSYTRAERLATLSRDMDRKDWLRLLGEEWQSIDNHHEYRGCFRQLLGPKGTLRAMMDEEELREYRSLDAEVMVYRGCSLFDGTHEGGRGLSWTLDVKVARKFPFLARYEVYYPVLFTATVKRGQIRALKLGCTAGDLNEREVIVTTSVRPVLEHLPRRQVPADSDAAPWENFEDLLRCPGRLKRPCPDLRYAQAKCTQLL